MSGYNTNRNSKDALFRIIFGDHPENALSLYNAINDTDYANVDDLHITTLRDAVYVGVKNDVSFLFDHDMNLYEHQSTFCPNMPLRGLIYFTDLYKEYLGGDDISEERMYSRQLQKIPAPKYYVFYNGNENRPEREELKLSSAYVGEGDIEVTAHMLNVNKDCNKELMQRCVPMQEYAEFISRVRTYLKDGSSKEEAATKAIDSCIEDGILEEILRKERSRVMSTLVIGLTEEQKERMHAYENDCAREEGREEGLTIGREEGLMKGREEGLLEGNKRGRAEAGYEAVDKLVAKGVLSVAEACETLEVDARAYEEYLRTKK